MKGITIQEIFKNMNWLHRIAELDFDEEILLLPPFSTLNSYVDSFDQLTPENFKRLMKELEMAINAIRKIEQGAKEPISM